MLLSYIIKHNYMYNNIIVLTPPPKLPNWGEGIWGLFGRDEPQFY